MAVRGRCPHPRARGRAGDARQRWRKRCRRGAVSPFRSRCRTPCTRSSVHTWSGRPSSAGGQRRCTSPWPGSDDDPNFAPEPLTSLDRQALFHGARSLTRQVLRDVVSRGTTSPLVDRVLQSEEQIIERLRRLSAIRVEAYRIRCHGDYHLGQVLWTGKDFVIIDFEGEPSRSLGVEAAEAPRRLRPGRHDPLPALRRAGGRAPGQPRIRASSESGQRGSDWRDWLTIWHRVDLGQFLDSYLELAAGSPYLPSSQADLECLLDFFRLEKAMYELGLRGQHQADLGRRPGTRHPRPPGLGVTPDDQGAPGGTRRVSRHTDLVHRRRRGGPTGRPGGGSRPAAITRRAARAARGRRGAAARPKGRRAASATRAGPRPSHRARAVITATLPHDTELGIHVARPRTRGRDDEPACLDLGDGAIDERADGIAVGSRHPCAVRPRPSGRRARAPGVPPPHARGRGRARRRRSSWRRRTARRAGASGAPSCRSTRCGPSTIRASGTYSDLARLGDWVSSLGGGLVGTLPLYPAFLDPPGGPEPLPPRQQARLQRAVHRSQALPEYAPSPADSSPRRIPTVGSPASARHPGRLRGGGPQRRRELEPWPGAVCSAASRIGDEGSRSLRAAHPELVAYARFRAGQGSPAHGGEPDPALVDYHLYTQWVACEQLAGSGPPWRVGTRIPGGITSRRVRSRLVARSPSSRACTGEPRPTASSPAVRAGGSTPCTPSASGKTGTASSSAALRPAPSSTPTACASTTSWVCSACT